MGLEVEQFERKRGKVPVASYVSSGDRLWLQERRIELNAMTSPQFLAWLDAKFDEHATVAAKVIPRAEELSQHTQDLARTELRRRATEALLREHAARIEAQVSAALNAARIEVTSEQVGSALARKPEDGWRDAVAGLVNRRL